jgi:pre-mRNA-splicing factor 38B
LYKLYTLKLTRKQLNGLLKHADSPYIRGLGFMYIRYALPPSDFFEWYEEFLQDEEEVDVKAGGGQTMTIGQMCRQFLTKLEWFSTLFPRIPVPVQKQIDQKLMEYDRKHGIVEKPVRDYGASKSEKNYEQRVGREQYDKRERGSRDERRRTRSRSRSRERNRRRYDDDYRHSKRRSDSRERHSSSRKSKYYDRDRSRSKERSKRYDDERSYHRHY